MEKFNLYEKLALFGDYWSPKIVGELNGQQVKLAKLKGELTPMGAIRAGNEAGTIPAWEGGITSPPAGFQPGTRPIDPYTGDQKLFTITAANMNQYRDQLSPGQIAMLKRYPNTWKMHVYPSRRSASYPQRIYDATIKNATTAELSEGGNGKTDFQRISTYGPHGIIQKKLHRGDWICRKGSSNFSQ